ncbi:hypothetical protein WDU94_002842 [Cyamophila willieti]
MNIYNHDDDDADATKSQSAPLLSDYAELSIDLDINSTSQHHHTLDQRNNDVSRNCDLKNLSQREVLSNDGLNQNSNQRDAHSNGFVHNCDVTEHSVHNEHKLVSQQQQVRTKKSSTTVSLLTRLARKKLKRKKFFYTSGGGGPCELNSYCAASDGYYSNGHTLSQHYPCDSGAGRGEDYNYEYIACDRCGGYKNCSLLIRNKSPKQLFRDVLRSKSHA